LLHPSLLLFGAVVLLIVLLRLLRWPLPLAFMATAFVTAEAAGFYDPFRHLVEGGFGYLNLILALFSGALFGQVMVRSGAVKAVAATVVNGLGGNRWLISTVAALLLFAVGSAVGIAGVAVLAMGVFALPLLEAIGLDSARRAAFVAVLATFGMVAPPVNVPAMMIADGVNMPFLDFDRALLFLSVPPAIVAVAMFGARARTALRLPASPASTTVAGFLSLAVVLGTWIVLRAFPTTFRDPSLPLVLLAGTVPCLWLLDRRRLQEVLDGSFSGTPLALAAVLVTVGMLVQVMALTGIRGWIVIHAMSFVPPWIYPALLSQPLFGGVLTAIGAANILGVPFAFAFIHQDMILNVSALSALAAVAEFCPPTAISAALASHLAGTVRWSAILRESWIPIAVMVALAIGMMASAASLAPYLV
jgi:H+/gluconate symporter-like permease